MRFSEAEGHKVVSTSTAETVGRVKRLVVDPSSRRVVALDLKKTRDAKGLAWGDIAAFGADAVTVTEEDKLAEHSEEVSQLARKELRILGKRVLSADGDELGAVRDVDFDPATGKVTSILLEDATGPSEVAGSKLVGIGSYAVVVSAD